MITAPRSRAARPVLGRYVLLLSALLAFGVIGWEHTYHSAVLGVAEEQGHLEHVVRDALLAFPLALVAVVAGLRLGRRFGPLARAAFVSVAFGLLLVPSVRLHDVVDGTHAHEGHGGLEASTGFFGTLLHGLRDAAVAEVAAVPLMLAGLFLLERATRSRRQRRWIRAVAVAATVGVVAFAFGGIGFASDTGASRSRGAVVHTFQLTDNPGNALARDRAAG
jgi:hypothetical protein